MRISRPKFFALLLISATAWIALTASEARAKSEIEDPLKVNKLLYMYMTYYLPFSVEFREGRTENDILPYVKESKDAEPRLIKAEELQKLDAEWYELKRPYEQKSLLLNTSVPVNRTSRISSHLVSHHISLSRSSFDGLSLNDRIQLSDVVKNKPPELQAAFKQLIFARSFLSPLDQDRFNFFIFSASWCESCKEYRLLLETYLKNFPQPDVVLQSVVIEDTKEEIFEKPLLNELFPRKGTPESIPRFLSLEYVNGKPVVKEEGEALRELYDRYLKSHRGYLDQKSTLFKKGAGGRALSSDAK